MSLPFFALPEEERAEWRGLPVTAEFIKYLDVAEALCAGSIISAVRGGKAKEAEILSGKLEAIQTVRDALAKRTTPTEVETEASYVDPAALWSVK